jgi:N-acetylglucosamine kinase
MPLEGSGYVLGVDGGASRTRCVIADLSGNLLARGSGGPSNPLTVGADTAAESILTAISEASKDRGIKTFKASVMGVAGTDKPSGAEALRSRLGGFDWGRLRIVSDAAVALAGATGCRPGVVVVSGTGSVAYGENEEGEKARAGGWGWRLGDEGSGYTISNSALIASLRALDGRGPPTSLPNKIMRALDLDNLGGLVDLVYSKGMGNSEIATLNPLVGEAAEEGDTVAKRILKEAGEELGLAASAVARRLGMTNAFPVALTGGVFNLAPVREALERKLGEAQPGCRIIEPRFEPDVGAALLALRELGAEIDESLLRRVEKSFGRLKGDWT